METVKIQLKAKNSRNRQVDFALKLIRTVGVSQAIQYCKDHNWHGTLDYVRKLGSSNSKYHLS